MIKKPRYLITTEDEKTWKFDQPVIFLGEWCRLYDRKNIWMNMDAVVSKPYGLDVITKDKDQFKVRLLEEKILSELCGILNENFHTNHSKRFWQIILGPWLRIILSLLLNRTYTIKQCLDMHEISGTTIYQSEYCSLSTPNFRSAYDNCFDNEKWNNVLNGKILSLIKNKISISYIKDKNGNYSYQNLRSKNINNNQSQKINFKNFIIRNYYKIANKLVKNNDAFLISTYLNFKQLIKLELLLGQIPQLWKKVEYRINTKPDKLLREKLTKKFFKKSKDDLENVIRNLLFELLPVSYLEGFYEIKKIVNKLPWPKSPRFIFTSNSFGTDEVFKLWTAIKVESGTKYYIGQHGNSYFTYKFDFPRIEEQTADKFLTWGWKSKFSKYVPMFNFKTAGDKVSHNNKGGLLLIQKPQPTRTKTWDVHSEFNNYFEEQKKLVTGLRTGPKRKLTIRLKRSNVNLKLNENSRWLDFDKSIKIEKGTTKLKNLIADNRLIIHTYDTTGMLENFSLNIPTLIFLHKGLYHLRESVKTDYQCLIENGIMHLSSQSIINKVNEIWNDVDKWWNEKNVQNAKNKFCEKYSKNIENPTRTLLLFFSKN